MFIVWVCPPLALNAVRDERSIWIESYNKQKTELELIYSSSESTIFDKADTAKKVNELHSELTGKQNEYKDYPFLFEDNSIMLLEPINVDYK